MGIVTDFQTKVNTVNSAMGAAALAMQRLRQAYDAALEQMAAAQAVPTVPAGAAVMTATELAQFDAAQASLIDSADGLMASTEANSLPAAQPVTPP